MIAVRENAPVAVLAPTGRDSVVAARVLAASGIPTTSCASMRELCELIPGDVGALLVAQEALAPTELRQLSAALRAQPAWSDVPLVVLTAGDELDGPPSDALLMLAQAGNLTLLDRPVRRATLLSTLRSALRARQRQFDLRRHLEERLENEIVLQEARAAAEVASLAKTRFLATMSHELRTPLNAIAGYTELMAMGLHGPVTEQQQGDLQRIERNQRYLLSLINDILNYAKIEAGHVSFSIQPFLLDGLLRALDAFVAPQIAAKGVRYSVDCPPGTYRVCADEDKTQQILLNLLSNALKFTPPSGEIHVSCTQVGTRIEVTIRDSGPGIPAEKLDSIFEPFVQLGRNLTTGHEGTGLGLSISRDLARKMSGDLSVHSVEGAGASFTLSLPVA
jgi:signal transduction histidine kinase